MIFVKETILKSTTEILLKFLAEDITANLATPAKSYLATIIGEQKKIGTYDFLEQAFVVFNRPKDSDRLLSVDYMYNIKRDRYPNLYIALAADSPAQGTMAMGQGYEAQHYTQIGGADTPSDTTDDNYTSNDVFTKRFSSAINLVILSDNSNEVVLIYEILRAGFISLLPHLSLSGFENLRISGQDLVMPGDTPPLNTYKRVIQFSFEYMFSAIDLTSNPVIKKFVIELDKILDK